MEEDNLSLLEEKNIKENGSITKDMVMGNGFRKMDNLMWVIGFKVRLKAMGFTSMQMETNMKGSFGDI